MPSDTAAAASGGARRTFAPLPASALMGYAVAIVAVLLTAWLAFESLQERVAAAERITRTYDVLVRLQNVFSSVKDAETGQRGYLLTGQESYLEPYSRALGVLPGDIQTLYAMTRGNPEQLRRLDGLAKAIDDKLAEMDESIALQRAGNAEAALAVIRTDRGKAAMDRIRDQATEMGRVERAAITTRQSDWQQTARSSVSITLGGSAVLLALIGVAFWSARRNHLERSGQAWLRTGQALISQRMQGDQRLDTLGVKVLDFLAEYAQAQVGALYVGAGAGRFRRVAGYGTGELGQEPASAGHGLLDASARAGRALHVRDVPPGYLTVRSSLGGADPRELLIAPAVIDGVVHAVLELGFFRPIGAIELALLEKVSESVAVAVRASKDRSRLEELLAETQRQSEELQTQQEELRVNNEELEEQGRALRESQSSLEEQQVELQASNTQLEEHMRLLEDQRDELSSSQRELTEKATDLARTSQYKSEFLANMSHELRTPLNSTLILAKLLADNKEGNLSEEQVKFATTIGSAGNDLLKLINDVLDLSKVEAGKAELSVERVGIARLVGSLGATFEPMAREKGLTYAAVVEAGAPERIVTDGQRLGQILKNLLSNAIKFTDAGKIALRVAAAGDSAVSFTVSDSGIGIDPAQHELVFEAFRQADGSTHRKYGGTGLGLSISRDLAQLLGGEITLESQAGKGSVFTLTLPRVYAAPVASSDDAAATMPPPPPPSRPAPALPAASSEAIAGSGARPRPGPDFRPSSSVDDDRDHLENTSRVILVVEDDVRFAAILRDLAREMGFQCIVTHSANDGIAAAMQFRPSAILLDMNLPDHSGLGVLDQLKRNPQTRHIPVHIASVADHSHEALERGAVGYALKPVKREQLVDALKLLESKFSQNLRHLLIVEDDAAQRASMCDLLGGESVEITAVETAGDALTALQATTFDCMVMDLNLPDLSGYQLLEKMSHQDGVSFPPVIVYTGSALDRDQEQALRRFSRSIIVKGAHSPERLLDEVTLFLHQVETELPATHQRLLKAARDRESMFEGRRILVVEDDVRNIFALTSVLEPKGVKVEIARNGREALEALQKTTKGGGAAAAIDLVLMDIMMPEMDGLTAMREIRKRPEWKRLPIIALTAKAMKDDQEKCLDAGANDYIAKPLDVEKLLSLVRVWLPS
ncbi:MAG: response regulator [Caldimonas sp.]